MPKPKPQTYEHPLLIASVIRAKSETRTPVQWRRFADQIEHDYYTARGERGGHPWSEEQLG